MTPRYLLALASLSLLASLAFAGVIVTKLPDDAAVAACVEQARSAVGAEPLECVQRTVIAGDCSDVPKPTPVTDVVIELRPAIYAEDNAWTPWSVLLPDGTVQHTFTNAGEMRAVELPDGSWGSEVAQMLPAPFPACWSWQWVTWAPDPPPNARVLTPANYWTPPRDAGAGE
jgi:hypothetical protein